MPSAEQNWDDLEALMGQDWADHEVLMALRQMLSESGDADSADCIVDIVLHKVADDYQLERAQTLLEHSGLTGVASSALQRALQNALPTSEIETSDEEWSAINTLIIKDQEQVESKLEELEIKRKHMQTLQGFMHLQRLENNPVVADAIQRLMMPPYLIDPERDKYYRPALVSPARRSRDIEIVERCIDAIRFDNRWRGRKERMAFAAALDWLIVIDKHRAQERREARQRWVAAKSMIDDVLLDSAENAKIADGLAQSAADLEEEASVDESIIDGLKEISTSTREMFVHHKQLDVRAIMRRNQQKIE